MSNIINIEDVFHQYKSDAELKEYISVQFKLITDLTKKNKQLEEEVTHLKDLLVHSAPPLFGNKIEKIPVSPEELLIDEQISIIQSRSLGTELNLEDVKKLDILIKNKKILKEDTKAIEAKSKKLSPLSSEELIKLVKKP